MYKEHDGEIRWDQGARPWRHLFIFFTLAKRGLRGYLLSARNRRVFLLRKSQCKKNVAVNGINRKKEDNKMVTFILLLLVVFIIVAVLAVIFGALAGVLSGVALVVADVLIGFTLFGLIFKLFRRKKTK